MIKEKLDFFNPKQKILIIDDLDRFDPEHLFRLISVLSAHIDHHTNEKKFGFDKIILVGDLQNFRDMFQHKYGIKNSFNGFISKLSSKYPFNYDPKQELYSVMPKLLEQFNVIVENERSEKLFKLLSTKERLFFNFITYVFLSSGIVSLREVHKKKVIDIIVEKDSYNNFYNSNSSSFFLFYRFIKHILIEKENLIACISNLLTSRLSVDEFREDGNKNHYISDLSTMPLSYIHRTTCANVSNVNNKVGYWPDSSKNFELTFHNSSEKRNSLICSIEDSNLNEKDIILLTIEALKRLENEG